jgi:effector-binding domain-containing protein
METSVMEHTVNMITWPGRTYMVRRVHVPLNKLPDFFAETYAAMVQALAERGIRPQGLPSAIYYSVDEDGRDTDVAAAIPVSLNLPDIPGFDQVTIPSSRALMVEYAGPYEYMGAAYDALVDRLRTDGLEPGWMLEEYLSDPTADPDPGHWRTNIIWTVQ